MKRIKDSNYIKIPVLEPRIQDEAERGQTSSGSTPDDKVAISYSLETLAQELDQPRVLLVDFGAHAVNTVRACKDAGLEVCVTYTDDLKKDPYVKIAQLGVSIGKEFSEEAFKNSYAILKAARESNVGAILLIDPSLCADEGFLGLASMHSIKVLKALDAGIPQAGWLICEALKPVVDENAWKSCPHCGLFFNEQSLAINHFVCPSCHTYFRMSSLERIDDMLDAHSFKEWWPKLDPQDPLEFPGYLDKLEKARETTELTEAVRCGSGRIAGIPLALCVMDSQFFMGSMGSIVGEKITRTIERATERELPLVIFTASGGARMQEGLLSLMQMAKISSAVARHSEAGLPYVAVLTDPTTGGVTASFAMQGDIIIAEPNTLIGFAGQRVIRDTIKRELPEGFQTAEFALEHGLIDAIIDRKTLRETLAHILAIHVTSLQNSRGEEGELMSFAHVSESLAHEKNVTNTLQLGMIPSIQKIFVSASRRMKTQPKQSSSSYVHRTKKAFDLKRNKDSLNQSHFDADEGISLESASDDVAVSESRNLAWESVQLARNTSRPTSCFYIDKIVDGFIELHGDRSFADDAAIICGIGWIGSFPVTVVAQEKGSNLKERITRNFGCPQPEGYRKSLRIMKQAERFGRPIVCIVDTQGAFCGMEAEERGQGNAIADNLYHLAGLKVPIISVLIGEGGSGGALALALADRVAMQRHAVYSVLSPEGFASILWKDGTRAAEAAAVMKMSAEEAYSMGVADTVLSEGDAPAHENPEVAAECIREYLDETLNELSSIPLDQLLQDRYERFRKF